MVRRHAWWIGITAMSLIVAACGSTPKVHHDAVPAGSANAVRTAPAAPADKAYNDADVTFAQHMIQHHQQGIEMTDILLGKKNVASRIIKLANHIKSEQGAQIDQLKGWLSQWGNRPAPSKPGDADGGDGSTTPAIVGMMSDYDVNVLKKAPGPDAGPIYVSQMVTRHEGAITMAWDEITTGRFPDAVRLAKSIASSQEQEIDTMRNLLKNM